MTGRGPRGEVETIDIAVDGSGVAPTSAAGGPPGAEADRKLVGGLVLSRHPGESIMIGDAVEVEVVGIKSGTVRLRIAAPREVPVHRLEVYRSIRDEPRPVAPAVPSGRETPVIAPTARNGQGGLVLTRHAGESIMIGDDVALEIVDIRPSAVRIRVAAPRDVSVHRREVYDAIHEIA